MSKPSKAYVVVGAGYGDEGKGLTVDALSRRSPIHHRALVVRYNGGAQAGHTVVGDGYRHVFHHIGSGHFNGCNTFLEENFICNPIIFNEELHYDGVMETSRKLGLQPPKAMIHVNWNCRVTTPWDMAINQALERGRRDQAHGSVGLGINETVVRSDTSHRLVVKDLMVLADLRDRLDSIARHWVPERMEQLTSFLSDEAKNRLREMNRETYVEKFLEECELFRQHISIWRSLEQAEELFAERDVIYEGAQGLELDEDNKNNFPHVTRSKTGAQWAVESAKIFGPVCPIKAIYVSRTYATRHGAGPFPEQTDDQYDDQTNVQHDYQGAMRFGRLGYPKMKEAIEEDIKKAKTAARVNNQVIQSGIMFTHLDQTENLCRVKTYTPLELTPWLAAKLLELPLVGISNSPYGERAILWDQ